MEFFIQGSFLCVGSLNQLRQFMTTVIASESVSARVSTARRWGPQPGREGRMRKRVLIGVARKLAVGASPTLVHPSDLRSASPRPAPLLSTTHASLMHAPRLKQFARIAFSLI